MFTEIQKDVEKAARESDHNYKYLRCLEDSFTFLDGSSQKAAQAEFPDIAEQFVPIFHFIRQIWNENSYYAKPERRKEKDYFNSKNQQRRRFTSRYDQELLIYRAK